MKPITRPWEPAFFAQWTLLFMLPIILHPASMEKIVGAVNPYWATAVAVPLLFGAGYLVGRALDIGIPHVEVLTPGEIAAARAATVTPIRARKPAAKNGRSRSRRAA
jgi:hypothetical protein